MNNIFLVFGYGIPKEILKDENYNFYLKMVFNKIYDFTSKDRLSKTLIIFCGGKTDTFRPYERTEADEMKRFFVEIIKKRPFLEPISKKWIFISERESLSTLENLLNGKKSIQKRKIKKVNLFIFCEQTRGKRIEIMSRRVFGGDYKIKVLPIDFDVSPNRYLPPNFLAEKEKTEIEHALWALRDPENLKKHHAIFEEKFEYFRELGPKLHNDAVRKWWKKKLDELENQKFI